MTDDWIDSMQSAVPERELNAWRASAHRMVDIVCPRCNKVVGWIADNAPSPRLTVWQRHLTADPDGTKPLVFAVASGQVPDDGDPVRFHCFYHGVGSVEPGAMADAISRYRAKGRMRRLVMEIHPS